MNWRQSNFDSVCSTTAQRDPTRTPNDEFRYIDIASVDKDAKRIVGTQTMRGAQAPSRARKEVRAGDVLVSTVRPNLNAVALVPDDLDGEIASTGFCVLRANRKLAEPGWIFYRCLTSEFVAGLVGQMRGANYPAVSDGVVKSSPLPLPAPSEQRRIVELLEQADALRRQRAEADALAARILPALFRKIFGDSAANQHNWPREPLGKFVQVQGGYAFKSDDFTKQGIFLARIGDLVEGHVRLSEGSAFLPYDFFERFEKFQIAQGDLLIALSGATTGKVARFNLTSHALLNQRVGHFVLRDAPISYVDYLEFLFRTSYIRNLMAIEMQGGGQPNLAPCEIESFVAPRPPDELLHQFASTASLFREQASEQLVTKGNLERLFQAMLHRAFTGELTARWREAHMKELLAEMEQQARALRLGTNGMEE